MRQVLAERGFDRNQDCRSSMDQSIKVTPYGIRTVAVRKMDAELAVIELSAVAEVGARDQ
jgi:hypothetical protein